MLLTIPVPPAGFAVRTSAPADAGALVALAATDNLFDEDPGTAPSGKITPDGARHFLADPSVRAWMRRNGVAEVWVRANTYAVGFYRKCGFATDEGEILVKELH
ncbi:UNVERIFIED_ORG: hypothetical protein J2X79_000511 [Arthrobacter globiformis]|nr:hypothetical protein [Arthrobacter globiformis]